MRKRFGLDRAPNRLAQSFAISCGLRDDVVQSPGLAPETELSRADPARHVFARSRPKRHFEVVDNTRPVRRQVSDHATLDQIDKIPAQTKLDRVRTHHQNNRSVAPASVHNGVDQFVPLRVGKRNVGFSQRRDLVNGHLMATFGQVPQR